MADVDLDNQLLKELLAARNAGRTVVLATVVRARGSVPRHTGSKMLIYDDGQIVGTIGGGEMEARVVSEALDAIKEDRPRLIPYSLVDPERGDPGVCGGEVEVYVEPYRPPATVLIFGCGHVGRAVAHLASWMGFRVVVSDDREEIATAGQIPDADLFLPGSINNVLQQLTVTDNTYIVVVTRNVLIDRELLPLLANTKAPYVGIIGSKRRWEETKRLLSEDGLSTEAMKRFHSPIGLELHAETPEEIAVSIMAEIIMLRHGGSGGRMAADIGKKE